MTTIDGVKAIWCVWCDKELAESEIEEIEQRGDAVCDDCMAQLDIEIDQLMEWAKNRKKKK